MFLCPWTSPTSIPTCEECVMCVEEWLTLFYMLGKCPIRNKLKEAAENIGLPTFVVADAGRTQVSFPRNNVKLMMLLWNIQKVYWEHVKEASLSTTVELLFGNTFFTILKQGNNLFINGEGCIQYASHFPPTSAIVGEHFMHDSSFIQHVEITVRYREEKLFQTTYNLLEFNVEITKNQT